MTSKTAKIRSLLLACAIALSCGSRCAAAKGNDNPGVIPVNATFHGLTYGEWSARWWQWAFSLPIDQHPLFDTADCSEGQSGPVWFLGATFVSTTTPNGETLAFADRTCSVPAGVSLFFPVANAEASTIEGNGATDAELRSAAEFFQDFVQNLSCEVDGKSIEGLDGYRVQSPLYTFGPLPDNNILQSFGLDAPAGSTSLSVADGVYLMLAPLPVGPHTIHFHAEIPDFLFFIDVTYHLDVIARRP
jgi:hypothetical protein